MNMYAIGRRENSKDSDSFAMWHGPHPSEREMLEVTGNSFSDYIVKFSGDPGSGEEVQHQILWRWHDIKGEWERYNPRVLNKKNDGYFIQSLGRNAVYIGRGSKWGNPFVIGKDGDREEVITKYMEHLAESTQLLEAIPTLAGKFLVCYCAPEPCHGDILIDLANPIDEGGVDQWRFKKYLPEPEDLDIKFREWERYRELVAKNPAGENDVDIFSAGFTRGLAWGIHKSTRHFDHLTRMQHNLYTGKTSIVDGGYEDDIPF
jgi:hypothetical protein